MHKVTIQYHKKFVKEFQKLPKEIQEKAVLLENIFCANPYHPELKTKKLQGKLQLFYSFRITRDYRIIFEFIDPATTLFLAAKHRKDIYK
ncbi:MAG: type II toxin-antitoxin system YoeB family toxin [Patescibacteria group bacterium]|nr:type II toxin-antitoxin system YoeB family toxin [Patescibacteria group bacterium]